jgi:hypothetical protein
MNRVAADVRGARLNAGLSLRNVADTAAIDHAQLWRFERRMLDLSHSDLSAVCETVGLELSVRTFPTGDPIRDAGQARLLVRLHACLHTSLRWATEVPLPGPGELRAWDAVIRSEAWWLPVEAETVLNDIQALERRLALKMRDGGAHYMVLLVADTRNNRRGLASAPAAFSGLPLRNRNILGALRQGQEPGGSGIVIL